MASHRRGKRLTNLEVVNRWCLDFYASEALDAFRDNEYTRFSQIRDHIQSLLAMPIEARSSVAMTLLVMQFLSRIYDGDKLETTFEPDSSVSPLESAISVLEMICAEVEVPQSDLERLQTSLREMAVVVCIKDKDFTKARKLLQKYFPTSKNSTSKAKVLSDLVRQKCSTHPTLQQPSYSKFRQNTLDFIERVYTMPQPFLSMVVRKKIGTVAETQITKRRSQRLENGTQRENHTEHTPEPQQEQNTSEQSSVPPPSACSGFLSLHVLTKVYEAQAKKEGLGVPFSSLLGEVYKEAQEEGKEEEPQPGQEGEEVQCTEVAEKITNLMENLDEVEAGLGPVAEKEAQEEDHGEEKQAAEEKAEDELHLCLSESELLVAEEEVVHTEEKEEVEAMEEEEEECQESESDRGKDPREPDALVPPSVSHDPAPEKRVQSELHHQELESCGEQDTEEENTSVPAVAPPFLSPDPELSMEEQQESEQERQKGETGGGERKEESVLDRERDARQEDVGLAVLPPPPLSPALLDYPFSETDSLSLLESTFRPTRSRPRRRTAQNGLESSVQPQTPGFNHQDPVGPVRPVANGPDALGVQIKDTRYCRVTVPQLIMMPDSQLCSSPSQMSATPDLKTSAPNTASEAEVSQLEEPQLLPDSEAEETAKTPPLVSTPRARRRLGNLFSDSPYKDSFGKYSEEFALAPLKRARKGPATPSRGTSDATKGSRDLGTATPRRGGSNTPGHQKNTSSDTLVRGSPARIGKDTPPSRCSPRSHRSLKESSDKEALDSFSPVRKRRKELTLRLLREADSESRGEDRDAVARCPAQGGARRRLGDPFPDSPDGGHSNGTSRRKELASSTAARNSRQTSPATRSRGTSGATTHWRELASAIHNRCSSSAKKNSRDRGLAAASRCTSSDDSDEGDSSSGGNESDGSSDSDESDGSTDIDSELHILAQLVRRCRPLSPPTQLLSCAPEAGRSGSSHLSNAATTRSSSFYSKLMNAPATKEVWENEDGLFNTTQKSDDSRSSSNCKKRMWTDEETRWVKEGVARFGEGKWERIRAAFPFKGRTGINIKDRWRTLKNNGLV